MLLSRFSYQSNSYHGHFTSDVSENDSGLVRSRDTLNFEVLSMIIYIGQINLQNLQLVERTYCAAKIEYTSLYIRRVWPNS